MKRAKDSSQEESSSRRQPRGHCLSWEQYCSQVRRIFLMQQRNPQWDALVRTDVLQHVRLLVNVIAGVNVMHCVEIHVTMTAQVVVRTLAMVVVKEVVDNNF